MKNPPTTRQAPQCYEICLNHRSNSDDLATHCWGCGRTVFFPPGQFGGSSAARPTYPAIENGARGARPSEGEGALKVCLQCFVNSILVKEGFAA